MVGTPSGSHPASGSSSTPSPYVQMCKLLICCPLQVASMCPHADTVQGSRALVLAHAPELCTTLRDLLSTSTPKLCASGDAMLAFLKTLRKLALEAAPEFVPVFASKPHMKALCEIVVALPYMNRECGDIGIGACGDVVRLHVLRPHKLQRTTIAPPVVVCSCGARRSQACCQRRRKQRDRRLGSVWLSC